MRRILGISRVQPVFSRVGDMCIVAVACAQRVLGTISLGGQAARNTQFVQVLYAGLSPLFIRLLYLLKEQLYTFSTELTTRATTLT
jgi:hypothetical protein